MSSSWFIKALVASQIAKNLSNEKYNLFNSDVTVNGSVITYCVVTDIDASSYSISSMTEFVGGYYMRSALTAALTITLPTASEIVAYFENCQVGSSFNFTVNTYQSGSSQTTTLQTATGINIITNAADSIVSSKVATFNCVVNNITSGSEAVSVYLVSLN